MRSFPPRPSIKSHPRSPTITSFRGVPFNSTSFPGSRLVPTIVAALPKHVGTADAGAAAPTSEPAAMATATANLKVLRDISPPSLNKGLAFPVGLEECAFFTASPVLGRQTRPDSALPASQPWSLDTRAKVQRGRQARLPDAAPSVADSWGR